MTFFGSYRGHAHPHESPWVVTLPLVLLAIPSAAFGYLYGESLLHYLGAWTRPDMLDHDALHANPLYHSLELISIGVALGGIALSLLFYTQLTGMPARISARLPNIHRFLEHKWWVDELYDALIIRPLRKVSDVLFAVVDRLLIDDALVNGSALFVEANGEVARKMQTGQIRLYSTLMFLGVFFMIVFYLLLRLVPL